MISVIKKDNMGDTPMLALPTTESESYLSGEALIMSNGKLTKCGAAVKPTYISVADYNAPETNPKALSVIRVNSDIIFEVENSVVQTAKIGDKVTLDETATKVTATTEGGVAEIVEILGTKVNDKVYVRF